MEESVSALAGPKGRHDPARSAVRHGSEDGSVVLGGRQLRVRRPRVRTADRSAEVAVPAYELFSSTEVLGALALERMMAKLSTRRYRAGLEPVGSQVARVASGTSRSAVSRRFVAMTERALEEMMHADLSGLDLVALMIDGVHFAEHLCVVALGITIDGTKVPLGVVEGSTENATVVKALLADLRDRGLEVTRPVLVVIDGAKALAAAVREVFDRPAIQRCQLHKIRNVEGHLPKQVAATVTKKMRAAYRDPDWLHAEATLEALARSLEKTHPGAAGSLRDAHHQPAWRTTDTGAHVAFHQRDRVHDRDLPRPQLQREALARRTDGLALVRGGDARSRQAVPARERPPPPARAARRAQPSLRHECHTRMP
jgi:transposase-like protein